ncbi:MAG: HAD family phosphatase [Firmicutes bacterium]|nr:HAD family phosphatase [Bacillota bacterium]
MRLVALDFDGTLLNRDGSIAGATVQQMQRLHDRGCHVAIATGRPYPVTVDILLNNGLGPHNGFPQILICDERDVFFLKGDGYRPWLPWNKDAYNKELGLLSLSRQVVTGMALDHGCEFLVNNKYMQRNRGYVEIFYWSREQAEEAFPLFVERLRNQEIKPVRNNRLIAFRWRDVGKGIILAKVAESLALDPDDVMAMGDSYNDLDMLLRFNAATTQNADDEIKDAVREKNGIVADSSYSLGVAEVLAQL